MPVCPSGGDENYFSHSRAVGAQICFLGAQMANSRMEGSLAVRTEDERVAWFEGRRLWRYGLRTKGSPGLKVVDSGGTDRG